METNNKPYLIEGGIFQDERGKIVFANNFDFQKVRRMYHIHQKDTSIIRAWQGHKKETKWFHCIKGSFSVNLLPIDNWESPSKKLLSEHFLITDKSSQILCIPGGYANGFKAVEKNSILLVYSSFNLKESKEDDFRFNVDYWKKNW